MVGALVKMSLLISTSLLSYYSHTHILLSECDAYTNNEKCGFDGGDCVLPKCNSFYNVSTAMECVSHYAERGKCDLSHWLDMFFNCKLHEAGINEYLAPIVRAGTCTWDVFQEQISDPLFANYLDHCWDDVPCYNATYDAINCVGLYAEDDKCDWIHWSEMVESCNLDEAGIEEYLLPIVKNNKCTWQRWSDHVYHELFYYMDHCHSRV